MRGPPNACLPVQCGNTVIHGHSKQGSTGKKKSECGRPYRVSCCRGVEPTRGRVNKRITDKVKQNSTSTCDGTSSAGLTVVKKGMIYVENIRTDRCHWLFFAFGQKPKAKACPVHPHTSTIYTYLRKQHCAPACRAGCITHSGRLLFFPIPSPLNKKTIPCPSTIYTLENRVVCACRAGCI